MDKVNASSLFHFTNKLDILKKIIKNGLRYSYAYEQYPKELVQANINSHWNEKINLTTENGVAIPMISFCDIPISRTHQHAKKYGRYIIGFDKFNFAKAFKNIINPVIYVHSPNLKDAITNFGMERSKAIREMMELFSDENIIKKVTDSSSQIVHKKKFEELIYPFIETRFLSNFLIGLVKPVKDENHYYYDEREWRLFLPEGTNDVYWRWGITKEEYLQNKDSLNGDLKIYKDTFIKIPCKLYDEYITHIIVSKEEEIDDIIELIMGNDIIFGYENMDDYFRMKLISKITSFERIEKDF